MSSDSIPVVITEEAQAKVDELELQRELQLLLDWHKEHSPRLVGIRVELSSVLYKCSGTYLVCVRPIRVEPPTDPRSELDLLGRPGAFLPTRAVLAFVGGGPVFLPADLKEQDPEAFARLLAERLHHPEQKKQAVAA